MKKEDVNFNSLTFLVKKWARDEAKTLLMGHYSEDSVSLGNVTAFMEEAAENVGVRVLDYFKDRLDDDTDN